MDRKGSGTPGPIIMSGCKRKKIATGIKSSTNLRGLSFYFLKIGNISP